MRLPAPAVARSLACALLAVLVAGLGAPAAAEPSATPVEEPKPGKVLCTIEDDRLREVSGLVTTKKGYVAVADGATEAGQVLEVFDLDSKCQVTERHSFQRDPFDPEDLAIAEDGTLWVADIGDNRLERDTVALWKISPDRNTAEIHRLTYPDGKHDAEALLMPPDGKPVIMTKDPEGAGIYVAQTALKVDESVPLTKAGDFKVSNTGTGGNRFGAVGQKLVTGAALSADGTRAVVRTYADAYEWKLTGDDVVAALTKGKPLRTPLPGEPQGEAITYSRDGKKYLTATEATTATESPRVFSYTPAKPAPVKSPGVKPAAPGWFDNLGLQDIKLIIAGFGLVGLALVFLGVWGIARSRGPRGKNGKRSRDPDEPDDGPPESRARGRATVGARAGADTGEPDRGRRRGNGYEPVDSYDPGEPYGRARGRGSRGTQYGLSGVPNQPDPGSG
ncbi:MAG: hypothetical protein ACRDTM_05210, partial [Micromonosporaceae bacterium]